MSARCKRPKGIPDNLTAREEADIHTLINRSDDEDACWPWLGEQYQGNDYGRLQIRGQLYVAHRVAFYLATGIQPGINLILHSCDNPPCCNPKHLSMDDQKANMQDMIRKGRAGWQKKCTTT